MQLAKLRKAWATGGRPSLLTDVTEGFTRAPKRIILVISEGPPPPQIFTKQTMENSNPYVQNLLEKGYTVAETRRPAATKQFPLTIYGRTFETQAEYDEAIAEFLNGN